MIKEIYFRDQTDPKFRSDKIETDSELEMLITQIRMILLSNKGEVLGNYDLGLDLNSYLFSFGINETEIRNKFTTQVQKYITNTRYKIDMNFNFETNGVQDTIYIYITIDDQRVLGVVI
jgi:hypothetical protein